MKKILLVCSTGMSTSILVKKMKAAAATNVDIHVEAKAMAEAQSTLNDWDVILLGPQVKYIENNIKSMTEKPVSVIPADVYALGKGIKAL